MACSWEPGPLLLRSVNFNQSMHTTLSGIHVATDLGHECFTAVHGACMHAYMHASGSFRFLLIQWCSI